MNSATLTVMAQGARLARINFLLSLSLSLSGQKYPLLLWWTRCSAHSLLTSALLTPETAGRLTWMQDEDAARNLNIYPGRSNEREREQNTQ